MMCTATQTLPSTGSVAKETLQFLKQQMITETCKGAKIQKKSIKFILKFKKKWVC